MKIDWKRAAYLLPVWIIAADLLLGVALNVKDALLPAAAPRPQDGLPVSPEFAFGWIQAAVNAGMTALVLASAASLVKMNRLSRAGERLAPTLTRALAVLAVLAFSLPALWLWLYAGYDWLMHHRLTLTLNQPRYLIVAACQPYLVFLAAQLWYRQYRLHHRPAAYSFTAAESADE